MLRSPSSLLMDQADFDTELSQRHPVARHLLIDNDGIMLAVDNGVSGNGSSTNDQRVGLARFSDAILRDSLEN